MNNQAQKHLIKTFVNNTSTTQAKNIFIQAQTSTNDINIKQDIKRIAKAFKIEI